MRKTTIGVVTMLTLALAASGPARAKSVEGLPVPGFEAARDMPGAHELPDPGTDYKVLFSVAQGAKNGTDVNPMLPMAAMYLNTLAKYGVPASHRHLVVMFHQRSADFEIVLTNEAYKARHNGQDNPNIAIIHALKAAGVDLRACGQGVLAMKIDPKDVNPDIQIDLWAMTSMMNLQMKGFARVG